MVQSLDVLQSIQEILRDTIQEHSCIIKTRCDGGLNKCPAVIRRDALSQTTDIAYVVMAGPGTAIHLPFH